MNLVSILIALIIVVALFPAWPYSAGWGYYPSGGGLLLLIIVLLLLSRRAGFI